MKSSFHGDFRKMHNHKRRLIGSRKERVMNTMMNKKTDPSVFVREEAAVLMREGNLLYLLFYILLFLCLKNHIGVLLKYYEYFKVLRNPILDPE